jgi:hypothetical protein
MHIVKTGARATRRGSGGRRSKSRLFTAEPTHKNARPASCGGDFAVFGLITPEKKPFFAFLAGLLFDIGGSRRSTRFRS